MPRLHERSFKKAVSCPNCGCPISKPTSATSGAEMVLYEGLANKINNFFWVENGRGAVTNQRFIYYRHSVGKVLALGLLANLTEGSVSLSIPLDSIISVTKGRKGLNSVLVIETTAGEVYKFAVFKYHEWERAFDSAFD